jgi:predicted nucleotidyltransferase
MAIRLTQKEIQVISDAVYGFDKNAIIYLFGSRTDESKKGGDIDLLVLSGKINYGERRKIMAELIKKLGDRKIDLIVSDNPHKNIFTQFAYKHGVKL